NRLLMEALAARGHSCRVVARLSTFGRVQHACYVNDLLVRGVKPEAENAGTVAFSRHDVGVRVVTDTNLRGYFATQAEDFQPDIIPASTDAPAKVLPEAALRVASARGVYLARATLAVPFGPDSAFPSETKTGTLRRADVVVGVSQYVAGYFRQWAGIDAVH